MAKRKSSSQTLPLSTAPMEAKLVEQLPTDPGWQFEPKWDGFRCLAFRDADLVELRTADCVVGGFRYGTDSDQVGSLLLGLYDEAGKLDHVGFTSSIPQQDRKALTKRLQKLIKPPGFTGDAPGAPSRWSTERSTQWEPLAPKLVVEVRYDHVSGDRFRHGAKLVRWRPDKSPRQCTFEQLQAPARPGQLIKRVLHRDAQRLR